VSEVRWPVGHEPEGAAIHEVNLGQSSAPPEAVWAWLVSPERWSTYYSNAHDMRPLAGSWPELDLGTRFSWVTFGTRVTTEVTEFEPFARLAWTGSGRGARGHHAWMLTPRTDGGTDIRTEETQRGALLKVVRAVHAPRMRRLHQQWVDNLARIATTSGTERLCGQ
jgi:uncharacterized protein YndB with AHSA1/START domain